jgi:hypothetical protein
LTLEGNLIRQFHCFVTSMFSQLQNFDPHKYCCQLCVS